MAHKIIALEDCIPVTDIRDGAVLSRDGALTIGWELFPPEEYGVTQESYDSMVVLLAAAFKGLPAWTMVHRQDVYSRKLYHCPRSGHFLDDCYSDHFEGRPYLQHRQFIWFSFNPAREGRAGTMKGTLQGASLGIRYRSPEIRGLAEKLTHFVNRCAEFVSVFTSANGFRARRLLDEELQGPDGSTGGILDEYLNWFDDPSLRSDICQEDGTYLEKDGERMFSYTFSNTDDLPGEVSNTTVLRSLSSADCDILLSSASPIGAELECEHIVNFYYLVPTQAEALRDLDRRRKNMTSMSKGSAENTVNAEGIAEFIDRIHSDSTVAVYTHMNLCVWGDRKDELYLRGAAGAALSSMGLISKLNTLDMPQIWIAGLPGAEMEIGEDNLMLGELEQALCLGINESFMRDFPGGMLRITDRHRHTPVIIDTQEKAYEAKLIENYNAFILGPSGSGKSFFTNWYVRNCFDAGQHVFIIDKGDSYEGLCTVIREETGGKDGIYYSWTAEHPFAFAPFEDCRSWRTDPENTGMNFLLSMLKIIWTPQGGWNSVNSPILYKIVSDFLDSLPQDGEDPVFDDFHRFLNETIVPRINGTEGLPEYIVGGVAVTPERFDIGNLCIAMDPYTSAGQFPTLLNQRHPADLFRSRFVVFEVDTISNIDETLYALCTFCIIHAFERKMHSDETVFRLMFIEEAWQAIATPGTAEYLKGLWKTARKYHTSATVVTQQVSDIISSDIIRDAILNNSPVKILLDQQSNAASFDDICSLLGLSPIDRALVRSVGRSLSPEVNYKEVFITLGGKRSGVYALEVSPEEAKVYESDKVKKAPLLEEARRCGSIRQAVKTIINNKNHSI